MYSAPYVIPKTTPSTMHTKKRVKLNDAVRQYKLANRCNSNTNCVKSVAARLSLNSSAGSDGDGRATPSRSRFACSRSNSGLDSNTSTKLVLSPLTLPTPAPITSSIHVAGL